jgi:hypothetical protein
VHHPAGSMLRIKGEAADYHAEIDEENQKIR